MHPPDARETLLPKHLLEIVHQRFAVHLRAAHGIEIDVVRRREVAVQQRPALVELPAQFSAAAQSLVQVQHQTAFFHRHGGGRRQQSFRPPAAQVPPQSVEGAIIFLLRRLPLGQRKFLQQRERRAVPDVVGNEVAAQPDVVGIEVLRIVAQQRERVDHLRVVRQKVDQVRAEIVAFGVRVIRDLVNRLQVLLGLPAAHVRKQGDHLVRRFAADGRPKLPGIRQPAPARFLPHRRGILRIRLERRFLSAQREFGGRSGAGGPRVCLGGGRLALAGVGNREVRARADGRTVLLNDVHQFVRQQPPPLRGIGMPAARAERDVPPDGPRLRTRIPRAAFRRGVGVDAHAAEIVPEACLHRAAGLRGQRLARLAQHFPHALRHVAGSGRGSAALEQGVAHGGDWRPDRSSLAARR